VDICVLFPKGVCYICKPPVIIAVMAERAALSLEFQSSAFSPRWRRKEGGVRGVASPLGRLGELFSLRVHAEV